MARRRRRKRRRRVIRMCGVNFLLQTFNGVGGCSAISVFLGHYRGYRIHTWHFASIPLNYVSPCTCSFTQVGNFGQFFHTNVSFLLDRFLWSMSCHTSFVFNFVESEGWVGFRQMISCLPTISCRLSSSTCCLLVC
jgi:hypothetical protein